MSATITSSVGYSIKKAQHSLRLAMDDALRKLRLTTPQYAVLTALSDEPGLSGAGLARRCFVTPQTMTGVLNNLADAGLVSRAPDPEHGRIIRVQLTAQGRDLLEQAQRAVEAVEERMLGDLDRAEREALADLLTQCADSLRSR